MQSKVIRVGVFDQIVSGGGGRFFTVKLIEELARLAGTKWHFHLMWPLFDSGNNFLHRPNIPKVSFERICVDPISIRRSRYFQFIHRCVGSEATPVRIKRWALKRYSASEETIKDEQRKLRLGDGRGLRWLDQRVEKFDLIYLPYPYLTLPGEGEWLPGKPVVITLHDLAHEHTDAWGEVTAPLRKEVRRWTELSDLVIFSSDYIKCEAQRIYGLPEERAKRIYLSPSTENPANKSSDVLNRYKINSGYVFTLGWAAKHKRVKTILEGFALFKKRSGVNVPLVLAGPDTERLLLESTSGLERGKDVFALGYVRDEDVSALYRNSSVVVTASVSEAGFNAMIFEAMKYGRPVICSNVPQFVERLGDDDSLALTFDPYSAESLAAALSRHFNNPERAGLRAENAKQFINSRTLSEVGEDYLAAFESVL